MEKLRGVTFAGTLRYHVKHTTRCYWEVNRTRVSIGGMDTAGIDRNLSNLI